MKKNFFYLVALCFAVVVLPLFTGCSDDDDPTPPSVSVSGISFSDTDSDKGTIGGTLSWNAPSSVEDVTKYVIYSSADGVAKGAKLGEVPVGTNSFSIASGTVLVNYIIVVAANEIGESASYQSFAIIDKVPDPTAPTEMVSAVTFADTDREDGKIGGTLSWTAPSDVSNITKYVAYLSKDGKEKGAKIGEVNVGTNSIEVPKGTELGAYIVVVAANAIGESAAVASVEVEDAFMEKLLYVLNSGRSGNNNASVTLYNLREDKATQNYFAAQNERNLGDIAQDILVYGGKIYIAVFGESTIEVTDLEMKSVKQIKTEGQPRYMVSHGGKVYMTYYDGHLARLDTASLEVDAKIKIGRNPEQLVISNDKLYVANSGGMDYNTEVGYDKTVSVVDIEKFEETKKIEVVINPCDMTVDGQGNVFLVSMGNYQSIPNTLQKIDPKTDEVSKVEAINGTFLTAIGNTLYTIFSQYDANWNQVITYYTYDIANDKMISDNFIGDTEISKPYKIVSDSMNNLYISTSDYRNDGDIYMFDKDLKFLRKFETGVNPMKAIYVEK